MSGNQLIRADVYLVITGQTYRQTLTCTNHHMNQQHDYCMPGRPCYCNDNCNCGSNCNYSIFRKESKTKTTAAVATIDRTTSAAWYAVATAAVAGVLVSPGWFGCQRCAQKDNSGQWFTIFTQCISHMICTGIRSIMNEWSSLYTALQVNKQTNKM